MEPDMVFPNFGKIVRHAVSAQVRTWKQIEFWKRYDFRVPYRKRVGPVEYEREVLPTGFGADPDPAWYNPAWVHEDIAEVYNFGFMLNDRTMWYKQQCALNFSKQVGDSLPSETWYEDKWLGWTRDTKNLEIAKNYTHLIPQIDDVPEQQAKEVAQYVRELKAKAKDLY